MANTSKGMKPAHLSAEFIKRTAGIIGGAAGDYIREAMPVTGSIVDDARTNISEVNSKLKTTTQSVFTKVRSMKMQHPMRSLLSWYMHKEDEFDDFGSKFDEIDSNLAFDTDTSDASASEIAQVQIGETEKASNKISKAVVETAAKTVEANMQLTGNILSAIDNQTAVITSGFDKTTEVLNKILEVVTKNTATLVDVAQASAQKEDPAMSMIKNGKFNLNSYLKAVSNNVKGSEAGMLGSMIMAFANPSMAKMMLTPENLVSMAFSSFVDKKNPNLKKNLKAVDDALNETIMNSLIRLGESDSYFGKNLAKMLGIKAGRKEYSGSMSTLELKSIPFDTTTKEAITKAIPGYLQKILVQLGGDNVTYDYKSRTFKTGQQVRRDFMRNATSRNVMSRSSSKVRAAFGDDEWGNMMYDMMYADLSDQMTKQFGQQLSKARSTVASFGNKGGFTDYAKGLYGSYGLKMSDGELKRLEAISNNLTKIMQGGAGNDIIMSMQKENAHRNARMDAYLREAESYGSDLRGLKTSIGDEIREILDQTGRKKIGTQSDIQSSNSLFGVNYTNKALYEIYRLLDRGINVFQVGKADVQKEAYKQRGDAFLPKPKGLQIKTVTERSRNAGSMNPTGIFAENPNFGHENALLDESGTPEERLKNWTKGSYGNLKNAVFSGSPDQVRAAFGQMFSDIAAVGANKAKIGLEKINQNFGNVTGYLKHKFLGSEYSYTDENGQEHHIKKNEKGGIFGFIGDHIKQTFSGASKYAKNWFNQVKGYFNYGDKDDTQDVKTKRSKLISTSVGAFAGAGLLGGPIGLLIGGLAGSALSGLSVGGKIKAALFGRDPKTGKAKGALTKLGDAIVDPIKFQIGKTAHLFGNLIKKNLLGPLSNIGAAIKERIKNAADTHFGFVFKTIGKVLLAPFKLVGNLAKLPFQLMGGIVRGGATAASNIFGGGLNSIAKGIAGSKGRSVIKDRIRQQKQDYKDDQTWERDDEGNLLNGEDGREKKYSKYRSYRLWRKEERLRKVQNAQKLDEFTKEEEYSPEEWRAEEEKRNKLLEEQKTLQEKANEDIHNLAEAGLQKDSIFTHDTIVHQQLNQIIELMGGRAKVGERALVDVDQLKANRDALLANADEYDRMANKEGQSKAIRARALAMSASARSAAGKLDSELLLENEATRLGRLPGAPTNEAILGEAYAKQKKAAAADESTSDAIVGAAGAVIAASGDVDNTESKEMMGIIDEASKEDSDPGKQKRGLARIFDNAKKKAEVAKEKSNSLFDKISGLFGSGGLLDTLKNILKYGGILALAVGVIPKIFKWIKKHLDIGEGVKNIASWVGDFLNPKKGNKDESATVQGYDQVTAWADVVSGGHPFWAWLNPFSNLYHNAKDSNGDYIKNVSATDAKNLAYTGSARQAVRDYLKSWGNVQSLTPGTEEYYEAVFGKGGLQDSTDNLKSSAKGMVNKGLNLGTGMLFGGAAGLGADFLATNAAKTILGNTGLSEDKVEGISSAVGNAANRLTTAGVTKSTLKQLAKKEADRNLLGKSAGKVVSLGEKMLNGFKSLISKLLTKMEGSKLFKGIAGKMKDVFSKLTEVINKFIGSQGEGSLLFKKFGEKAGTGAVKGQGQWLAAIPTLTAGLFGEIEGITNYQYLFGVSQDTVDYDMMEIGTLWKGIVNAAEWSALWPGILFLDVADTIVAGLGILQDEAGGKGLSISQFICRSIYLNLVNNADVKLTNATMKLQSEIEAYNNKYGANLTSSQYNDMVGEQGWFSKLITGGDTVEDYYVDENGEKHKFYRKITDEEEETDYRGLTGHLKATKDMFKVAGEAIGDGAKWLWEKATDFSDYMAEGAGIIKDAIGDGLSWLGGKITDFSDYMAEGVEDIGILAGDAWDWIKEKTSDLGSWIGEKVTSFSDYMAQGVQDLGTLIGDAGASIWGFLKDLGGSIGESVSEFFVGNDEDEYSGVVGHLKAAKDLVGEGVSWVGDKVGDFFSWLGFGGPNSLSTPNVPFQSFTTNNYYGMGGPEDNPLNKKAMITSPFGKRTFPKVDNHNGIDLVPADGTGKSVVNSTAIGTVSYVKNDVSDSDTAKRGADGKFRYGGSNSGGNQVWIDTDDGRRIKSMHLKANSIPKDIKPGSKVFAGTPIGEVGSTGWSTGPHLHYQVEDRYGKAMNPGLQFARAAGGVGANTTFGGMWFDTGLGSKMFVPTSLLDTDTTGDDSSTINHSTLSTVSTRDYGSTPTITRVGSNGIIYWSDGTQTQADVNGSTDTSGTTDTTTGTKKSLTARDILRIYNNMRYSPRLKEMNDLMLDQIEKDQGYRPTVQDIISDITGSADTDDTNTIGYSDNFSGDYNTYTTTEEEEEPKGILAQFIDKLKGLGGGFLDIITGGLYSQTLDEKDAELKKYLSETILTSSDVGKGVGGTNMERFIATFLNGTDKQGRNKWSYYKGCAADRFLEMCDAEMGTTERNHDNINKYTIWFRGGSDKVDTKSDAWCMMFVQWCFNNAGIPLKYKTAGCDAYYVYARDNNMLRTANPKRGDIVLFTNWNKARTYSSHTGIYEGTSGSNVLCIEGNVTSFNNEFNKAGDLNGGKGPMGGAVAKRYTKSSDVVGYVTAVDFDKIDKIIQDCVTKFKSSAEITNIDPITGEVTSGTNVGSSDLLTDDGLYTYLKGMGYSDAGIAGIMGNWKQESGSKQANRFQCVEGISDWADDAAHKSVFDAWKAAGFDKNRASLATNRKGLTDYTHALLKHKGYKVDNVNYHSGSEGYPGLGIAQWTGSRGKTLLDRAVSKNKNWYDPNLQMDLFKDEMTGNHAHFSLAHKALLSATDPAYASSAFASYYEYNDNHIHDDTRDGGRVKYAKEYYNAIQNGSIKLIQPSSSNSSGNGTTTSRTGSYTGKYSTYDAYPGSTAWNSKDSTYTNTWAYEHPDGLPINKEEWNSLTVAQQSEWDDWIKTAYNTRYKGRLRNDNPSINGIKSWFDYLRPNEENYVSLGGPDGSEPNVPFIGGKGFYNNTAPKIGSTSEVTDLGAKFARNIPHKSIIEAKRLFTKLGTGGPVTSVISPSNGILNSTTSTYSPQQSYSGSVDLSGVISAIVAVVRQLEVISTNTSVSNSYLDSINSKDFVDQGLRNSLSSLKSASPKTKLPQVKSASARGANALVTGRT